MRLAQLACWDGRAGFIALYEILLLRKPVTILGTDAISALGLEAADCCYGDSVC